MKRHIFSAFSIAQLVIVAIGALVIMSTFAPVVTKKINSNDKVSNNCELTQANCAAGYVLDLKTCKCNVCTKSCGPNCNSCDKCQGRCSSCNINFVLKNNLCVCDKTCPQNSKLNAAICECIPCTKLCAINCDDCDRCTGICNSCKDGYELNSGFCVAKKAQINTCNHMCNPNCLDCDKCQGTCRKCKDGYELKYGTCIAKKIQCNQTCNKNCINCDKCQGICLRCKEGYLLDHGTCLTKRDPVNVCNLSCDTNCSSCNSCKGTCNECKYGYELNNGRCVPKKICNLVCNPNCLDCDKCQGICRKCKGGYKLISNSCIKIDSPLSNTNIKTLPSNKPCPTCDIKVGNVKCPITDCPSGWQEVSRKSCNGNTQIIYRCKSIYCALTIIKNK